MKEQLVTFETAKLAKEKDFKWECNYYYDNDKLKLNNVVGGLINKDSIENLIICPTQSLLHKFLMERYEIYIQIQYSRYGIGENASYGYEVGVWNLATKFYRRLIINKKLGTKQYTETSGEALELGLQEVLKTIKKENIVKEKIEFMSDCCEYELENIHGGITGFECKKCKNPCEQKWKVSYINQK